MNKKETVYEALTNVKREYVEEAENFSFKKRRANWPRILGIAAAACLIIALAAILIKPGRDRDKWAVNDPTPAPISSSVPIETNEPIETGAPMEERLVFSEGNEFPDYGADVLADYSPIVLEFPEGNPYFSNAERSPLAAKLLLPKGWTVENGSFEGLGYYPVEEFLSYGIASRLGNGVMSVYNEKGECVGSIGLAATAREYPGIDQAFAAISMGNGAFRLNDGATERVSSGKNGEAYVGRRYYTEKLASPENRLELALPAAISYDTEFLVGIALEFGENAVTGEQLTKIAESIRFALLNENSDEKPTAAPTAAPNLYNREEYDTLLAFFELKDSNGVKNGEKCFKNYDSNKVRFWGDDPEKDAEESLLVWNDDDKPLGRTLNSIILEGLSDETRLVGSIRLDKFRSLKEFSANRIIFEALNADMRNSFDTISIGNNVVSFGCDGEAALIADYIARLHIGSFSHCRYESTGEEFGGALAFTADLTADGSGHVGVYGYMDTHYYIVKVYAEPENGYGFLGWFDAEGSLISAEETLEISYLDENGTGVHDFTGTARFEPVQSALKTDPWYLETAWEYAELANREYGFRFDRDEWSVSEYLNAISFSYGSSEDFLGSQLSVHFIEGKKEVDCAEIWNDVPSDAPVDYASLSEEERKRLHNERMLVNSYTVTPHDMENAGYTLDGTDLDYVKIAEYCSRINVERLTGCSENNHELCREVDIGSVFMLGTSSGNGHVYCNAAYYFRPAYPLSFLSDSMDTVCNMIAPDDAEHPGWLTYDAMGSVNITKTADGWECHTGFPSSPAIGPNNPLVANPRYLEKAWEYAEFANREYGFSFAKYIWEPRDNAIVFSASKPGMNNRQTLYVFFHELNGVEIIEPVLMGDSSDIPAGYSELGEAEREAIDREIANLPEYHVTPQDMLQAGYTLDGTEQDYIKIAEYCGRRYAAIYTSCSEINPQFCNEAEAVNARRNELMIDSAEPIYCYVTYYFRPAYPLSFTDMHGDIGCNINELDDADHPGLITFGGDVLITPTDNGWNCKIAFISGY